MNHYNGNGELIQKMQVEEVKMWSLSDGWPLPEAEQRLVAPADSREVCGELDEA